jgi:hypothetical protein
MEYQLIEEADLEDGKGLARAMTQVGRARLAEKG